MPQVEFNDHMTTYVVKLGNLSQGLLNQGLNKGGAKGQKHLQEKAKRTPSHKYNMRFNKRHERVLTYGEQSKRSWSRQDLSSGHTLKTTIGDLARFKLYPATSVMLVGFLNTKSFTSLNFEGGVQSKGKHVKGTQTKEIARKLQHGGKEVLTDEKKRLFRVSGWAKAAKRGYVMKEARPLVNKTALVLIAERTAKREFHKAVKEFKEKN